MKHLIAILLAFAYCSAVWAQSQLLRTTGKSRLCYVDLNDDKGIVYTMGNYFDKAGSGYSITNTDTLFRQPDGSYTGRQARIVREKEQLYLVSASGKTRKSQLSAVTDMDVANSNLNNAWYLNHYFTMSKELNEAYPLNHHSFREAYFTWDMLPEQEKEMGYLQFREWADRRLKAVKDSISAAQEKYIRLTNYIRQNIGQIDYATLKDSIARLPAEYAGKSRYFGMVIDTVALRQPEYFFRLAEDFPEHQSLILFCGIDNRQAQAGLEKVPGHDAIKKEFFKKRKTHKTMPFYAMGSAALGAGLLVLIVAAF